jgi:hypothetical protein
MFPRFLFLLGALGLIAPACSDDAGDDDSSVTDDDDDDDGPGDDDDTSWDNPYEPPPDLAPLWGGTDISEAEECIQFALPAFALSVVQWPESLVQEYGSATCPQVEQSGPFDEHLTVYTGGCDAGGWAFEGSFSVLDTDAVSFHIFTYVADHFYVRPTDNAHEPDEVQDDEFFFHGMLTWSYTMEPAFGTLGVGLGMLDTDDPETAVLQEGFEAHLAEGTQASDPAWNHLYFKGWTETRLDADVNVEVNQDLYVSSAGYYTFSSSIIEIMSNADECLAEPLSGHWAINGLETIQFAPDGDTICDGRVPIYVNTGASGTPHDYYEEDIW